MVTVINNVIGKTIYLIVHGTDAKILKDHIFGKDYKISKKEDENITDINTKVWFKIKSVEGREMIGVEVAL